MNTSPIRVPAEIQPSLKSIAALRGQTPGVLLAQAFQEFLVNHREEVTTVFEHAQKLVASQDVEGLAHLLDRSREARLETVANDLDSLRD
jgi:predicted transcriptional regulator